ncbi:hypothetical protein [Microseira wollei]|nr:hypothetical protein [Microseira wollei]
MPCPYIQRNLIIRRSHIITRFRKCDRFDLSYCSFHQPKLT